MVIDEQLNRLGNLEELKQAYGILEQNHGLPKFVELNKLFDIEDVDVETDFLLRKIRRVITDKIVNYLRFIEVVLNPSSAPMFFFKLVKKLDNNDRDVLNRIYNDLGKFEIEVLGLDLDYNEKKEVEFINNCFKIFDKEIKLSFIDVINKLNNGEGKKKEDYNSYCG